MNYFITNKTPFGVIFNYNINSAMYNLYKKKEKLDKINENAKIILKGIVLENEANFKKLDELLFESFNDDDIHWKKVKPTEKNQKVHDNYITFFKELKNKKEFDVVPEFFIDLALEGPCTEYIQCVRKKEFFTDNIINKKAYSINITSK